MSNKIPHYRNTTNFFEQGPKLQGLKQLKVNLVNTISLLAVSSLVGIMLNFRCHENSLQYIREFNYIFYLMFIDALDEQNHRQKRSICHLSRSIQTTLVLLRRIGKQFQIRRKMLSKEYQQIYAAVFKQFNLEYTNYRSLHKLE